jgi:hypothetical protein
MKERVNARALPAKHPLVAESLRLECKVEV